MKVKRSIMLAASLLAMLTASGCNRKAEGQVVAVVNGEEITLQELNAEARNFQISPNADKNVVRAQMLQRIVDRRLMAMAAKKDGLDKDQDYLLRQRQMDDSLLTQLMAERVERTFRIPDAAAIDKYIAAHPTIFGNRTIYHIDQILFAPPENAQSLRALEADHTMDAVATRLTSLGIKFARSNSDLDSATLPPEMVGRIQKLPAGEPFVVPQPGAIVVGVILNSTPAPVNDERARPVAVQLMKKEAINKAIEQRLKGEQSSAKIEYQPGYAPPKPDQKKP